MRQFEAAPRYWADAQHEVDFIIQRGGDILPVEAKAGENISATSIKRYLKNYEAETPFAVRLSTRNLSFDGKILNVPLFLTDELHRLLDLIV